MVRRRSLRRATITWAIAALALAVANVAAAATWAPSTLSKRAVTRDLARVAPGFRAFLSRGHCKGSSSVQHCVVTGSISNDNVRARITLRHTAPVRYVDNIALTAGMGGGTVKRTFRGKL